MPRTPLQLDESYALRAAWAIPIDGEPIRHAQLIVEQGTIRELTPAPGRPADGVQTIDLGDVALLPGFVNAHAHLDFSDLRQPLGEPGVSLPEWIGQVFAYRAEPTRPAVAERIALGCRQAAQSGTTLVGDVVAIDEPIAEPPLDWLPFRELIGLTDDSVEACATIARQFVSRHPSAGLSPHAPYTVRRDLLASLVQLSKESGAPLMMHIAETVEELQLLGAGQGPFAELLQARGVWSADQFAGGLRCLDYLQLLSAAARALVVHGNYLDDEELEFLASHSNRMALIFCPRTHAYFRHPRHKIVEAAALGVQCAIGTDGRGSSPDLDMLAELRTLAVTYAQLSPEAILRMGTLNGAVALGCGEATGSLAAGKRANLVAVAIDANRWDEPRQAVLFGDGKVTTTIHSPG
ncbi:MAG: amidohydrolase family protein [Pirellulales bacterium]